MGSVSNALCVMGMSPEVADTGWLSRKAEIIMARNHGRLTRKRSLSSSQGLVGAPIGGVSNPQHRWKSYRLLIRYCSGRLAARTGVASDGRAGVVGQLLGGSRMR